MIAIHLDHCHDVTGGSIWPPLCEPQFPPPTFPPFPDQWGGDPGASFIWFPPICVSVD